MTYLIAGAATFAFTTVVTAAGVGAAFILIPVFLALGIEIHVAMATALLLNVVAMAFANLRYIPARLVEFRIALPILVVAAALAPVGAYASKSVPVPLLKWFFAGFLLFAGSMMLFYRAKATGRATSTKTLVGYGLGIGTVAGFFAGLLGVGGGNFVVPVLVWLGFDPKKASATTTFIVLFSSLSGFVAHASFGAINTTLLVYACAGSVMGAALGSWLMQKKLQSRHVKLVIGVILYGIAVAMAWKLLQR